MAEKPDIGQGEGKKEDAPAATPQQAGVSGEAANGAPGELREAFADPGGGLDAGSQSGPASEQLGPMDGMGHDPGPAFSPGQMGQTTGQWPGHEQMGPEFVQGGSMGSQSGGPEGAGFRGPPGMTGGQAVGSGPQQAGPGPGLDPHFGHHMHHPFSYGPPGYDPHIGGPHPGSAQHSWYCQHHAGMYGPPPGGPSFGPAGAPGFGYSGGAPYEAGAAGHHGQFADMVGKALQGQATTQDLISGLLNLNFRDDQFWKGVVVGSVTALLINSDAVRQALAGALGGILGKPEEKAQAGEQPEDTAPPDTEKTK